MIKLPGCIVLPPGVAKLLGQGAQQGAPKAQQGQSPTPLINNNFKSFINTECSIAVSGRLLDQATDQK